MRRARHRYRRRATKRCERHRFYDTGSAGGRFVFAVDVIGYSTARAQRQRHQRDED